MAWWLRAAPLERAAYPVAEAMYSALIGAPRERRLPGDDPPLLRPGGVELARFAFNIPAFVALAPTRLRERDVRDLEGRVMKLLDKPVRRAGVRFEPVAWPAKPEAGRALAIALEPTIHDGAPRRDRPVPRLVMVRMTVTDAKGAVLAGREFYSGYDLVDLVGRE